MRVFNKEVFCMDNTDKTTETKDTEVRSVDNVKELDRIKKLIRDIPDFPKKGIVFKDITPLLKNPDAFSFVIKEFSRWILNKTRKDVKDRDNVDSGSINFSNVNSGVDFVVSAEARGFILGSALAYELKTGFVPLRKPGKLPYKTIRQEFKTEYSTDAFEIHEDALFENARVVIIDDVLATGGTASAAIDLVRKFNADIVGVVFLIELSFLNGRSRLKEKVPDDRIYSLIKY